MLRKLILTTFVLLLFLLLIGCAASPRQTESLDYHARAETKSDGNVHVSAVVLSPQETENTFSVSLSKKGIQPVWIKVDNQEDKEFALMLLSIDPNYFAPSEVAWKYRSQDETSLEDKIDFLMTSHIQVMIPPRSTVSGFVYTNLDPGAKVFAIELVGEKDVRSFDFIQLVPGFEADFMRVNFNSLYQPYEIQNLNIDEFRQYLENLPCCVLGGDQKTNGDPLNLVIVGEGKHVLATLIRRSWDLTETMRSDTKWRTMVSSIFRSQYRTSPVSPLYLFDRPHDIALQKSRSTVDERNHLRLWLAPVTLEGQKVWVGQISRDIGVKFSSKTFITHKIDPMVDEARLYITLDVAASQALKALGYAKGVGYSDRKAPGFNYTDDPYYTDGLRVVLILGEERRPLYSIEFLHWEKLMSQKNELIKAEP
ncbi:MAG: LssY C-terminal domain-containing protein [Gammaproteobacteria bacterium]|jgi:hypothetical protein